MKHYQFIKYDDSHVSQSTLHQNNDYHDLKRKLSQFALGGVINSSTGVFSLENGLGIAYSRWFVTSSYSSNNPM